MDRNELLNEVVSLTEKVLGFVKAEIEPPKKVDLILHNVWVCPDCNYRNSHFAHATIKPPRASCASCKKEYEVVR